MQKQINKKGQNKQIRGIIFLAVFYTLFQIPLFAFEVSVDTQKYPVEVYGDYLEYRTKDEQVIAKGKAFISYQDMKISGDNIQANTGTEDIFAQGDVDFWKGYDQVSGDFIVYNMKTGRGWMRNAEVRKSRNYFKAKDVYLSPEHTIAHDIMQTTCDNIEHPHYRLEARLLESYPGHSMTMEGLRAKWRGKTIFYQAINRSTEKDKSGKFFTSRQGSSDIDGYYVKLATDLFVNDYLYGKLNYDWYEKRGYGYGFNGTYSVPNDKGSGSLYYYGLNETKRGHYNKQVNLSYNLTFKSGETFSTTINYTGDRYNGQPENQDMTVTAMFRPVLKFINMTINMNKFYDIDKDKYILDKAYQFVNRLPEINFSLPAWTAPLIPITMNFSGMYGHYEESEGEGKKDTEKKDGRLTFSCPAIEIHPKTQITPSYNFEKSYYTGDIERETGNIMVRASHKFSNVTNLEFN
ncbi:MAG: LPS-assembly protein LptD, partial [Candidatus Riflebacteria bacterium]|nr:LPS-assembly protein LptD [Candidatus Riflebacteria bacterium]